MCSLLVGSVWVSRWKNCPNFHVFEKTPSYKLANRFRGCSLSFQGRDLLQSKQQTLVQKRETAGFFQWKLRESYCFTVDWNCINGDSNKNLTNCINQTKLNTAIPQTDRFLPFLLQVRMRVIVIGRETFVASGTVFWCRSHYSSFWWSNESHILRRR